LLSRGAERDTNRRQDDEGMANEADFGFHHSLMMMIDGVVVVVIGGGVVMIILLLEGEVP